MEKRLYRIKLSTIVPYVMPSFPLLRQTPAEKGVWAECQFLCNEPVEECDAWFIYDGLSRPERTSCPPDNIVFITAEPPAFKSYPARWLRQFSHVISCQRQLRHDRLHLSHTALPWFVNRSYDQLVRSPFPEKKKTLSVICSMKRSMKWHRQRNAFVAALEAAPELDIDIFGRGSVPLEDKWDGLGPYRFSIAMENSFSPDYWTEKIGDCFLAGTVPIYAGCPNLGDYFPSESFVVIQLKDIEGSIRKIREIIARENYEKRLTALRAAKDLVLNRYNLFNLMTDFSRQLNLSAPRAEVCLQPEPVPSRFVKNVRKWRRRYWG